MHRIPVTLFAIMLLLCSCQFITHENTNYYSPECRDSFTDIVFLAGLPEKGYLIKKWEKYLIKGKPGEGKRFIKVLYKDDVPLAIEGKYRANGKDITSEFTVGNIFSQQKYTAIKIEYKNDTAMLSFHYFDVPTFFRLTDFLSTPYLKYQLDENRNVKYLTAFLPAGSESAIITAAIKDRQREIAYKTMGNAPLSTSNGVHKIVINYDDKGNMIEEAFFDKVGRPAMESATYKHHLKKLKYDDKGNMVEEAFFGPDGRPAIYRSDYKYHINKKKYDGKGNIIEEAFFGPDGRPALYRSGYKYHIDKKKYDDRDNITEEAFFDTEGRPATESDTYKHHLIKLKYDDKGNMIEEAFFDAEGRPATESDTYKHHLIKLKYDDKGNMIEEAFFDSDGKPAVYRSDYKYSIHTKKFDDRGNLIEEAYFGPEGRPALFGSNNKYHINTRKYDDKGHMIEEAYFGSDGREMSTKKLNPDEELRK